MFNNGQQNQQSNNLSAGDRHDAVMQQLDEIKRYVAGIFQNVDTEINEIRDTLRRIEAEVKDNDRQLDKIENFDRQLKNIESNLRNVERKIK